MRFSPEKRGGRRLGEAGASAPGLCRPLPGRPAQALCLEEKGRQEGPRLLSPPARIFLLSPPLERDARRAQESLRVGGAC